MHNLGVSRNTSDHLIHSLLYTFNICHTFLLGRRKGWVCIKYLVIANPPPLLVCILLPLPVQVTRSPPGCWLPLFCSRTNCPICRCWLLLEETYDVSDLPVVTLLLICNYCFGVKTVKSREWSNILVKTFTVPVQARPRPSGPHLGSHTSHVTMCPTKNTNCSFSPSKCNTVRSPERDLSRNCKNSSWMYFTISFFKSASLD